MTLIERLKRKYKTPEEAAIALGMDAALATGDAETNHDPHTGQFTGTSGSGGKGAPNTAELHTKAQAEHEDFAGKHRVLSNKNTTSRHTSAARQHFSAASLHRKAGQNPALHEHATAASESAFKASREAHEKEPNGGMHGKEVSNLYLRGAHDSKGKLPMTLRLSPQGARLEGALATYLTPRIATDAKLPDLRGILSGAPTSNRVTQFAGIVNAVKASAKLATDADLDDLTELLEAVAKLDGGEEDGDDGMSTEASSAMPMVEEDPEAEDDEHPLMAKVKEFCQGKLSPEDCAKLDEMIGEEVHEPAVDEDWDPGEAEDARRAYRAADAKRRMGKDESDEDREKREREDKAHDARMRKAHDALMVKRAHDARRRLGHDESEEEKMKREREERAEDSRRAKDARDRKARDEAPERQPPGVTKEAMDAAIKTAVDAGVAAAQAKVEAKHVALADVRQWLGNVQLAADSAESVYRQALKTLHVPDAATIHESALKALLHAQPKPGVTVVRLATDAAIPEDIASRYPNSARVTRLGA